MNSGVALPVAWAIAAAAVAGVSTRAVLPPHGMPVATLLARYDLHGRPDDRWTLPKALNEISGLAMESGRLYAQNDEKAIVFQLDPASHRIVSRFALGQPAVRGDSEAIVVVGQRVFLTTSDGDVLIAPIGEDGASVAYLRYATGIGKSCEIEGMAWDPGERTLLFACKTPRVAALVGRLTVFAWSPERRGAPVIRFSVPRDQIADLGREPIHPSELLRDPATGHLLLLAARACALIELSAGGEVLAVARLKRVWHRQAEGLALAPDGSLLVADEAAGDHPTLTTYRPSPR
ncbi:MAG: esterase-like activity of phytase family protein [Gemmatimonadales bacterium]